MRVTTMLKLAPMLVTGFALTAGGLYAQTAPTSAPPVDPPAATTTVVGTQQAPIRSTLKPAPDPNDSSRPRQKLVTVFGSEECPKPSSPDEVVVCARLPDSDIYRIPKRLRSATNDRLNPFQSNRSLLLGDASGSAGGSIGSCSVIGGGGSIGCTGKDIDAWAHDRTNRMGAEQPVPPQ